MWLHHVDSGCWVGNRDVALFGKYLPDPGWSGGLKAQVEVRPSLAFAARLRGMATGRLDRLDRLVDQLLDLHGERAAFAQYVDVVMAQEPAGREGDAQFLRRVVRRAAQFAEFVEPELEGVVAEVFGDSRGDPGSREDVGRSGPRGAVGGGEKGVSGVQASLNQGGVDFQESVDDVLGRGDGGGSSSGGYRTTARSRRTAGRKVRSG